MSMQAELQLRVDDIASLPSGSVNDDRIGHAGNIAWVIDGATDLVDAPLVGEVSDAAWLAETIDHWLRRNAFGLPDNIVELVPALSEHTAHEFDRNCRRNPRDRFEFPSASGLIFRVTDGGLDYVSIGDCTLLVETAHQPVERFGVASEDAGDVWISNRLEQLVGTRDPRNAGGIRSLLMPDLRAARERMNCSPGYGVFSITPPPPDYVVTGRLSLTRPTRAVARKRRLHAPLRCLWCHVLCRDCTKQLSLAAPMKCSGSCAPSKETMRIASASCGPRCPTMRAFLLRQSLDCRQLSGPRLLST